MMTATPTKMSLENISSHYLSCFTVIQTPGTQLVETAFKLRKRMKNLPSCVHVLHKTLNLVISRCCFAGNGKDLHQNVKRTCRAMGFAH